MGGSTRQMWVKGLWFIFYRNSSMHANYVDPDQMPGSDLDLGPFYSILDINGLKKDLTGVQLLVVCCSSISELVCWWVLVLFHLKWWILIYMFTFDWLMSRGLHADETTFMCIWTTAEPRVRLLQRKTGKPPSNLLLTVPRLCFCCGLF